MTKKEERYKELYIKSLAGGKEMLERAYELDKIADKIKEETEYNFKDSKFEQAVMMNIMACELRNFYKKMFH